MAVVIDELESVVDGGAQSATPGSAPAGSSAQSSMPMDDDEFRLKYGRVIRAILAEELERQRRNRAG